MSDYKTYTRTCMDCGKLLTNVGRSTKRCLECAARHSRALSHEWDTHHTEAVRNAQQETRSEQSRLLLHTDVRAADKAGLSYGKYMLLKMQTNKRACPCANTDKPKG